MYKNTLLLLCVALLMSACSPTSPNIRSNSNASVDINQYKTFGFFEQLDTDHRYESLLSQYLKEATRAEMTQRGFVFSKEGPDLLINFSNATTDKQEMYNHPRSQVGYYNYRGRIYYDTWIGYEPYIDNYQHGILTIDIVDRQYNKTIWQGVAEARINKQDQSNLQITTLKIVSAIFKQFPMAAELGN